MTQEKPKTYYRRMKEKYEARITELTKDCIILVESENFMDVAHVKTKWKFRLERERTIWFGDVDK